MKALLEPKKDGPGGATSAETERLRVGVVIITYRRPEALLRTLAQVLWCQEDPADQVVVVDGGQSTDSLPEPFRIESRLRIIHTDNRSKSHSRNVGWQHCDTELVAYTDDDCDLPAHWLRLIRELHEKHPETAAVGGPTENPFLDNIWACAAQESFPSRKLPSGPIHSIPTNNIAYRREALQTSRGFDESWTGLWGEDTELNWRLSRSGQNLHFYPELMVVHRHRNSLLSFVKQRWEAGRAFWYTRRKWPDLPGTIPDTWRQRLALTWAVPVDVLKLAWRLPLPQYGKLYAAKKIGQITFNLGLLWESMKLRKKQPALCPVVVPDTGKTRSRPL